MTDRIRAAGRPGASSPISEPLDTRHEDQGGDPVCWLDRVCSACGRLDEARRGTCPACGAPVP
jgi:hypothetical protein